MEIQEEEILRKQRMQQEQMAAEAVSGRCSSESLL